MPSLREPRAGSKFTYNADRGLADRATGGTPLRTDQAELDLQPGTEVEVHDYDKERDLVLVEWTDASGNPRITSVELDDFNESFQKR
jgi:hypothetical protein